MSTVPRGFSVQTRFRSVEEFVDCYSDRVGPGTIFVNTIDTRFVGAEYGFAILLHDKRPVLAGTCSVVDVFRDSNNPYKRPGMQLAIKRLGAESQRVIEALEAAKELRTAPDTLVEPVPAGEASPRPAAIMNAITRPTTEAGPGPVPRQVTQPMTVRIPVRGQPRDELARTPRATPPIVRRVPTELGVARVPKRPTAAPAHVIAEGSQETRTPGSTFVLPANPFMNLSDASLEGYVECRLFETPAAIEAVQPPPGLVPVSEPIVESLAPATPNEPETEEPALIVSRPTDEERRVAVMPARRTWLAKMLAKLKR